MEISVIIVVVIVTALAFDFTNGFHDTANAVATSIATGALKPRTAVLIAGILNLVGAFLSVQVAKTISSGLVDDTKITPTVIFAGLVGAIVWNLLTWLVGLPSSSSHALIGGLIGATWVAAGADAVKFASVVGKVLLPAVLAPIIAGLIALIATFFAYRITARAAKDTVTKGFKLGQIVSGSMVALAHGTNDAQKTMGIITLTLITAGALPADAGPPFWVILSSGLAISLGTYAGGWRIIQTLGMRVSKIETPQGFAAGTSTATVILTSSHLGFPLSTTQVATGSIFGAGAARGAASVHWGIGGPGRLRVAADPARGRVIRRRRRLDGRHRPGRHDHRGPRAGRRRGRDLRRVASSPGHRRQRQRHTRAVAAGRPGGLNGGNT